MTAPRDEDAAWLDARERGEPLPPIDPARARAYDELQALIAALPDEAPPAGWEADVRAALHPGRAGWRPRAAVAAAVAAAAVLLLWIAPWRGPSALLHGTPSVRIVRGETARHGDSTDAAIGDALRVEAPATGGELRIYRDDREVVVRCPGQDACGESSGRLTAELRVTAPGRYRAVYLAARTTSPLTGALDGDVAACRCDAQVAVPVVVR